ncbi:MAG: 50S ribosomal protein L24 [Oligosphaeraceae bacterium]|nr:50S ribosomal protein L24 [Oligosphaeraceae bacterium]
MSKANKIRKGDLVYAIAGDDKGRSGRVLRVEPRKNLAYVEGLKLLTKTVRRSPDRPDGGIDEIEGPIHLSNLMKAELYEARRSGAKK